MYVADALLNGSDKQHPCPIHAWTRLKPPKHDSVSQIVGPLYTIIMDRAMRIYGLISKDLVPVSCSCLNLPPLVPAVKFPVMHKTREIVRYCLKYVLNGYATLVHDLKWPRKLRRGVICHVPYFHYCDQGVCGSLSAVSFREREGDIRACLGVNDAGWIEADVESNRRSSYR